MELIKKGGRVILITSVTIITIFFVTITPHTFFKQEGGNNES